MLHRMVAVVAAGFLAAGCAGEASGPGGTPGPSPAGDGDGRVRGEVEWLAAFDVAEEPEDLQDLTDELLAAVPEQVVVGPAGCWDDVHERMEISRGTYVAGVVAPTERALDRAVEHTGREPVFSGRVLQIACFN